MISHSEWLVQGVREDFNLEQRYVVLLQKVLVGNFHCLENGNTIGDELKRKYH